MSCFQILKEKGFKLTPQRIMILQVLHSAEGHITAEEIYQQIKSCFPGINISTVYRTLELLKSLGLVTETDFGDGVLRYHHIEKGHHHHLICRKCHKVIDVDEEDLEPLRQSLMEKHGFLPELRHLAIFGLCRECREGR